MRLLLAIVLAVAGLAPVAAPALAEQPLAIFVHGTGARTRLLATYESVLPIRVRVAGDARRFDAVTVTASGPDGRSESAALVKSANGFIGSLRLAVPGTWTLALTTRVGSVSAALAGVPIAVANPVAADPFATGLFGFAFLSCLAGLTLIARPHWLGARLPRLPSTKRS